MREVFLRKKKLMRKVASLRFGNLSAGAEILRDNLSRSGMFEDILILTPKARRFQI